MTRKILTQLAPSKSENSNVLQRAAVYKNSDKVNVKTQTNEQSRFNYSFAEAPVHTTAKIQPKLKIGAVGDKYEQEADRVAAQVVHQINAPASQRKPIQRQEILEDEEMQMKPMIQLSVAQGDAKLATPGLETSINQARGSGQALANTVRQPMEREFGADFSKVRVHADSKSDNLNQSIQAKAFTTGQDVFFRQGEYNPSSKGGQELIAHELTHVVQQNSGAVQRSPQSLPKLSGQHVIQRYLVEKKTGYLISENSEAILKSDGSKELYLADDSVRQANEALQGKNVANLKLEKGSAWQYLDKSYTKVLPKFENVPGQYQGKVEKGVRSSDKNQHIDGGFVYGFKLLMNFLSSCSNNPWYKDSLKLHREAVGKRETLLAELDKLEVNQNKLMDSQDYFKKIRESINNDIEKGTIKNDLNKHPEKLMIGGRDIYEKLLIYVAADTIEKGSMLAELDARIGGMEADIKAYNEDTPYLPTACHALKNYLLDKSNAVQNGGHIGDYHYIDYSALNDGPWNNHYASIIFTDGGDTVSIEDAAGQAQDKEKTHWYYKMYGTQKNQTFEFKTNAEYNRRLEQTKQLNNHEN